MARRNTGALEGRHTLDPLLGRLLGGDGVRRLPDLGADPGRFTVAECGRSTSTSAGADSGRDGALRPEEGRAEEGRGATVEAELGREEGA